MKTVAHKIKKIGKHVLTPIRRFLSDSHAGIALIACSFLSILLANLPSASAASPGFWSVHRLLLAENDFERLSKEKYKLPDGNAGQLFEHNAIVKLK